MKQVTEFGARLEKIRLTCGFKSQIAFADFLGASKTQYNNWVNGTNGMPVDYAQKLRERFGYTLDFIYCGDVSSLPLRLVRLMDPDAGSDT